MDIGVHKEIKEQKKVFMQVINSYEESEDDQEITPEERSELEDLYSDSIKNFRPGEVVKGNIVKIDKDLVLVDVGFKSEGTIPLSEFPQHGKNLRVGDSVDVLLECIENKEGCIVLSKEKANEIKVWDDINNAYEKGECLDGVIVGKANGGLTIDIGLKAFLPGSQIDVRPLRNLEKLIGQKMKVKIIKMNKKRNNIVVSRRVVLENERKVSKESLLSNLQEGKVLEGIIRTITEYGAFVDLGGVDGLLHITDMSWGRLNHPSELFAVGDKIEVIVLKYDTEQGKISLGYKQLKEDPWNTVENKFPLGSRVRGKVVNLTDYGAFVELEPGVEALVHISEMSWNKHIKHPSKLVAMGDIIEAVVLDIDKEKKRISLGMKQTETNPWLNLEDKYPVGSVVEGKIKNITNFGIFVELEEGIEGLIHVSDISWTQKIKHPSELYKKKDQVKAVIIKIDKENERISLGIKQLDGDPWDNISERYPLDSHVKAKVSKIVDFGFFAELPDGIEGLIKKTDSDANREINVGDELDVKVSKVEAQNRKITFTLI